MVVVCPSIEIREQICGHEFTVEWLLKSLEENDDNFRENHGSKVIRKLEAKDISGGKGMFSIVLKVDLHLEEDGQTTVYTTILKIPGTNSWEKVAEEGADVEEMKFGGNPLTIAAAQMHGTECDFYEIVAPILGKFVPKVHSTKKWIPGIEQGCLHMEDLSIRGKNMDIFHTLNESQFKNVVDALAYFHAKVLVWNESEWRGKFVSQRNMFTEMIEIGQNLSLKFLEMSRNGKEKLAKLFFDEKIHKLMCSQEFKNYAFFESFKEFGLPTLLVHSDLWASNIMFETDDFGHFTDKLAAILDWQCLHEGNWLFDLVRLMICNLDGDIRREMETFIFDFYLDRLHFHLKENGHQEKVAFSAKQVKEAYETLFLGHMDHATCMPGGLLSSRGRNLETDAVEAARVDRCTLRAIHVLEDAQKLINSGRFDKWL